MLRASENIRLCLTALALLICSVPAANADEWTQANHDAARSGRSQDEPKGPFRLEWARQFPRDIMATRIEPIVSSGRVFVGTYSGRVHALGAADGPELWTAALDGPILHSVAVSDGVCLVATAHGSVYGLRVESGDPLWRARPGDHGFSTSPLVIGGLVVIGSRGGTLYAYHVRTGQLKWRLPVGATIRTTAASDGKLIYFAAEDMRARACDIATGKLRWTSAPLPGQSMRDYYPVLAGGRAIYRSNPAGPYAERLAADRAILLKTVGVDGSDPRAVDTFLKSAKTRASTEQVAAEQAAIREALKADPFARTIHILDSATGREAALPPVFYAAGCQGVGIPPVLGSDGRLLVLNRSALNNWSLGVAPLVGIGYLDPKTGALAPLRHESGDQPPWNTFWGTADETTRLTVGGGTLFLSHQGTIAGFDLKSRKLNPIAGNRDTWGGFPSAAWARNEWHGPARGAVAIAGEWIYWISGSRVIAVRGGAAGTDAPRKPHPDPSDAPRVEEDISPLPTVEDLSEQLRAAPLSAAPSGDPEEGGRLDAAVRTVLSQTWKPLTVQPGLAESEVFFARPSELFEALLVAYPHVVRSAQRQIRERLAAELSVRLPCDPKAVFRSDEGVSREFHRVHPGQLQKPQSGSYPLAGMHSVWLYAATLNEWDSVRTQMSVRPEWFSGAFQELKKQWPAIIQKRENTNNRVVADLLAYARIASWFLDPTAEDARRMAAEGVLQLIARMREFDPSRVETSMSGSAQIDAIVSRGDALFVAEKPHKARIALVHGITPELARILDRYAPNRLGGLFQSIDTVMPGWYFMGEERQVHFGENFIDFPDQALWIFVARAGAGKASREELRVWMDMPFCKADLYDLQKRAYFLSLAPPER